MLYHMVIPNLRDAVQHSEVCTVVPSHITDYLLFPFFFRVCYKCRS